MKNYKLQERLTNEKDIYDFVLSENLQAESKLIIDDNYYILRVVKGKELYYMHIKDAEIVKICWYMEEK